MSQNHRKAVWIDRLEFALFEGAAPGKDGECAGGIGMVGQAGTGKLGGIEFGKLADKAGLIGGGPVGPGADAID
jgi:hypothetical protein